MKSYKNVLDKLYDTPWLITKSGLEQIIEVVERKIQGQELSEEELRTLSLSGGSNSSELQLPESPSVAILPIQGSIFPKANLMTEMSGGTSVEKLKSDFTALMDSDMVTGILLDMDTPGGSAEGIKEMADVIYNARQTHKKPIHAIANFNAHSAGLYLASQADKFFASDSGMVGSLGVVAVHTESSKRDAEAGIKRTILSVGKYKADGNPHEPLSDSAKEHHLETMQELYTQFVGDVARGRGLDSQTVEENFGQGRSYRSKTALKRGMIDGISTLDNVLSSLAQPNSIGISVPSTSTITRVGGSKMELTPETLALLGLSEDATEEMVSEAISALKVEADKPAITTVISEVPAIDPELASNPQYAELAAEVAKLRETDRKNSAKMFAGKYAQFITDKGKTGFGLSALAVDTVEELHLKIADGLISHADLSSFLDNIAAGTAIVDYRELGSNRGEEGTEITDGMEAAKKLQGMAYALATEEGLSYGDALSKVMTENKELAQIYRNAVASPSERGEN
jgi:capsid assembly protease